MIFKMPIWSKKQIKRQLILFVKIDLNNRQYLRVLGL